MAADSNVIKFERPTEARPYDPIPRDLLLAAISPQLRGTKGNVLLAIAQMTLTYGGEGRALLKVAEIAEVAQMKDTHVAKALRELEAMGALEVVHTKEGRIIGIIDDYARFVDGSAQTEQVTSDEIGQTKSVRRNPSLVTKSVTRSYIGNNKPPYSPPTKKKARSARSVLEGELAERFARFWEAYPVKVSKGQARTTFAKLNPDESLMARILDALACQKADRAAKNARGEFVPRWKNPSTWLNGECWDDEVSVRARSSSFDWKGVDY